MKKDESKSISILRWVAFVPASILAFFVGYVIWVYGQKFFMSVEPGGFWDIIIKLIGNGIAVFIACFVGVYVAPSNKEIAKNVMSIIFIFLAISSMIVGYLYGTNDLVSILSAIIVIIASCYMLFNKYEEK